MKEVYTTLDVVRGCFFHLSRGAGTGARPCSLASSTAHLHPVLGVRDHALALCERQSRGSTALKETINPVSSSCMSSLWCALTDASDGAVRQVVPKERVFTSLRRPPPRNLRSTFRPGPALLS